MLELKLMTNFNRIRRQKANNYKMKSTKTNEQRSESNESIDRLQSLNR